MRKLFASKAEALISSLGLLVLGAMFARWWLVDNHANKAGHLAALTVTLLFACLCLRFVRRWLSSWSREELAARRECAAPVPLRELWPVFALTLLAGLATLALILALRAWKGDTGTLWQRLETFRSIDTGNYLDIAVYGYAPTPFAQERRIAFYPLYPLLVRGVYRLSGNLIFSGTAVGLLFYALSDCALYCLLRLDYPQERSRGTLRYLVLLPAAFFFALPMSESVFFFCSLMGLLLARREHWLAGCLFGALSAACRSLGVLIFAPLLLEAVSAWLAEPDKARRGAARVACCLLVPLGTAAYLYINYRYYGDPLYFLAIEWENWGQSMGSFFATTAYQVDNALADVQTTYYTSSLGIWFPNVICTVGALLLMAWAAGKLRPSYSLWFIVYYYVAISPSFLISAPRYLVAAVPLYPALAALGEHRKADRALSVLCALFSLAYIFAFISDWNVY